MAWKTEQLQLVKLFHEDLQGANPFFVPGQEWIAKDSSENYLNNFVDIDNIEDFEDLSAPESSTKQEFLFKRFHEIPLASRLDILYYLCQQKLDGEQAEFMQELQSQSAVKPVPIETMNGSGGLPLRLNEEIRIMLEPCRLGLMKPLATIHTDIPTDGIHAGRYYFFPFFQDTRLYRELLDRSSFELYLSDCDELFAFMDTLE